MSINVLNRRVRTLTLLTMAVSLGLFGCSDNDNFNGNIDDDTSDSTYAGISSALSLAYRTSLLKTIKVSVMASGMLLPKTISAHWRAKS